MRTEIKVYENTNGIQIKYDIFNKEILETNDTYSTKYFKKYNIKDIVYDEHVVCCFYRNDEHPYKNMFDEKFLDFIKLFTHYGLSVILDDNNMGIVTLLVVPNEKVKLFKS